ncbi:hypothetical protein BDA96_05G128000 [Sorghum bicolor]|uniref:Uncharacterized protein n=1 Tax=Sorghum bicolor TaxID=4558 RepID=A0A921UGL8_SORBI|nr:hypothetical protein BDA96_05G128000 [Sorghum bicolor]
MNHLVKAPEDSSFGVNKVSHRSCQHSHGVTGQHNRPKKRLLSQPGFESSHHLLKTKIRGTSLPLVEFFLVSHRSSQATSSSKKFHQHETQIANVQPDEFWC